MKTMTSTKALDPGDVPHRFYRHFRRPKSWFGMSRNTAFNFQTDKLKTHSRTIITVEVIRENT